MFFHVQIPVQNDLFFAIFKFLQTVFTLTPVGIELETQMNHNIEALSLSFHYMVLPSHYLDSRPL